MRVDVARLDGGDGRSRAWATPRAAQLQASRCFAATATYRGSVYLFGGGPRRVARLDPRAAYNGGWADAGELPVCVLDTFAAGDNDSPDWLVGGSTTTALWRYDTRMHRAEVRTVLPPTLAHAPFLAAVFLPRHGQAHA